MTLRAQISPTPRVQRAHGSLRMAASHDATRGSCLKSLHQAGSYRAVFPRPVQAGVLEAVIVNTAGGVTCGDRFSASFSADEGAQLSVTTQAAERIYRSVSEDSGHITTKLNVARNARLLWLPQETILFDGSHLSRRLSVELDPSATFVMVEPLVFGRTASGENLNTGFFKDSVSITSKGEEVYLDRVLINGKIGAQLNRMAIARGAKAMASVVVVAPNAADKLEECRRLLPETAGASLVKEGVLVVRCLASDSFVLRKTLLPILRYLTDDAVPKSWRL